MIRTLVFDMGNVLVRFSHERMCDQIGRLCGRTGSEAAALMFASGLWWDVERGRCDDATFHRRFEEAAGTAVPLDDLRHAACDIFEPIAGMVEIVSVLKERGTRLVLLSNTSDAHYAFIRGRWPDLLAPFDARVLSYEVGALKPEPAIYKATLAAIGCAPGEAFYTDDIPAYVEAGRTHGLDAEVFTTPDALLGQLTRRGIKLP